MREHSILINPDNFDTPDEVLFYDPRKLLREALKFYAIGERYNVAEYAEKKRYLDNRGGGHVGKWDNKVAPYLVGPMEALTGPYLTVAVAGPAQCGKTSIGQNWLLHSVETDPARFLFYAQTDDIMRAYVKTTINTMIDLHSGMKERLGSQVKDNSLWFKKFAGMSCEFLSATYNNLTNKSAPRIVVTELDACNSGEQDAYTLMDIRRTTFGQDSMMFCECHPDLAKGISPERWNDGIMRLYRDSDRRIWWWACPHCNAFSSPTPGASREMILYYNPEAPLEEIRESAALLCPCCGGLIGDHWRRSMNQNGFWAGAGQIVREDGTIEGNLKQSDIAGFWITGLISPFIRGGIGQLAHDLVKETRDFERTGDDTSLRAIIVKKFGIPYTPPKSVRSMDAEMLAMRQDASLQIGIVPEGVRYLTASVDVQGNRFELMVRGWGVDQESWIIDYRQIPADPAKNRNDWDKMVLEVMRAAWPLADGSGRAMEILAFGYDSGGEEGVTSQAYDVWRRARRGQIARFGGEINGRAAYTILPLKGMPTPNAPLLAVRYPNSQKKSGRNAAGNDVPLGQFNPNLFKDKSATSLLISEAGPGYVHFPDGIGAEHEFFDQLTAEERDLKETWHKKKGSRRNEAWDLLVMTDVMHTLFGGERINWDAPPGWARPWDQNIMVKPLPDPETASEPPVLYNTISSTQPKPAASTGKNLDWLKEQARRVGSNTAISGRF